MRLVKKINNYYNHFMEDKNHNNHNLNNHYNNNHYNSNHNLNNNNQDKK